MAGEWWFENNPVSADAPQGIKDAAAISAAKAAAKDPEADAAQKKLYEQWAALSGETAPYAGSLPTGNTAGEDLGLEALGVKDWFGKNTYNLDPGAWAYQYGVPQQYQDKVNTALGYGPQSLFTPGARALEQESRGAQSNALAMLSDYASGNKSVARQQGDIERNALAARIAGATSARPYDPAAMRGGQMALASGSAELGSKTALAAAQEKLAAQQALMQGASGMRTADITQFGQESSIEKSLRDYQIQKDTQAQAWQKLGLGEKAANMANAQDWQKQQTERDSYLMNQASRFVLGQSAPGADTSVNWGQVAAGGASVLGGLLASLSDERAKNIVPSGAQCKQALASGNPALANFLQTQTTSPAQVAQQIANPSLPSSVARPASFQRSHGPLKTSGVESSPFAPYATQPAKVKNTETSNQPQGGASWGQTQYADVPNPEGSVSVPASATAPAPGLGGTGTTPIKYRDLGPQPTVKGANSATVPAPGLGGAGTQMAQPGDPIWPSIEAGLGSSHAQGVYGHTLTPATTAAQSSTAVAPSNALSIIQSAPLAVENAGVTSAVPAGGGASWYQTPQEEAPAGGASWYQDPSTAGGSILAADAGSGTGPSYAGRGASLQSYDIGPTGSQQRGYDIGPTGQQRMPPVGLGSFQGVIFSDERCKIIDGKVQQLELDGRGMTAEAQMWRTKLDNLRSEAAASPSSAPWDTHEPMPDMGPLRTESPSVAPSAGSPPDTGYQESTASPALSQDPLRQQAMTTTPGEETYENAADKAATGGGSMGALPGAIGGIGKGLGAIIGELTRFKPKPGVKDAGRAVPWQTGAGPMGGIAQSLLSDISAKQGMQPTDRKLDDFLDEIEPTQFRYKQPYAEVYGAGKRTGVIAQDVAKSDLGSDMVLRDPQSGMLMLDTRPDKFNPLVLASLAHLAHRLDRVEK